VVGDFRPAHPGEREQLLPGLIELAPVDDCLMPVDFSAKSCSA
jgi:hypothetical protein